MTDDEYLDEIALSELSRTDLLGIAEALRMVVPDDASHRDLVELLLNS